MACSSGNWKITKITCLPPIKDEPVRLMFSINILGLDNTIWTISRYGNNSGNIMNIIGIYVYNLQGKMIRTIPIETNAIWQVLPGGKVLVDKKREVKLVTFTGGKIDDQIVYKRLESESRVWHSWHHASREFVYDVSDVDGQDRLTLFQELNGIPIHIKLDQKLLSGQFTVHKKDKSVLITRPNGIHMLDSSTGNHIWRRAWDWPHHPSEAMFYHRKIILTETLCCFVYAEGPWTKDDEGSDSEIKSGNIMMRLFETKTGKELYCGQCWTFKWDSEEYLLPFEELKPCAVGDGNVVCVASIVVHHRRNITMSGATDKDQNGPSYPQFYNVNSNDGVTFVCAKYNPENGSCKISKCNTSMEEVLFAKCVRTKYKTFKDFFKQSHHKLDNQWTSINIDDLVLHGITHGNIALGHVKFDFHCIDIDIPSFGSGATVFTIDLDKVFDNQEPIDIVDAINFPLNPDILKKKPNVPDFCPYYRTTKHGVKLAGLISAEGKVYPEHVTIHSFKTVSEKKQRRNQEDTHSESENHVEHRRLNFPCMLQ